LGERITEHLAAPLYNTPRERLWKVRAKHVILAAGAIERPLVFPDNDRPGIMLASATQTFANRYGVKAGSRAVVFAADATGFAVARDLHDNGVVIASIISPNPREALADAARTDGFTVHTSSVIIGSQGLRRVSGACIGTLEADGRVTAFATLPCDLIAMAGGWTPNVNLASQSRGTLRFDEARQIFVPGVAVQAQLSVGSCNGTFELAAALAEGARAGCDPRRNHGGRRHARRGAASV
jgi:sarcosine oxidase, subunit alpha